MNKIATSLDHFQSKWCKCYNSFVQTNIKTFIRGYMSVLTRGNINFCKWYLKYLKSNKFSPSSPLPFTLLPFRSTDWFFKSPESIRCPNCYHRASCDIRRQLTSSSEELRGQSYHTWLQHLRRKKVRNCQLHDLHSKRRWVGGKNIKLINKKIYTTPGHLHVSDKLDL